MVKKVTFHVIQQTEYDLLFQKLNYSAKVYTAILNTPRCHKNNP